MTIMHEGPAKNTITSTSNPGSSVLSIEELEEVLIYFSTSIFGKNTEEDILWDLARNCISKLGFVDCVIYLVDASGDNLIQKAALGSKNPGRFEILNPIEVPLGEGITGYTALTGEPQLIFDTSVEPRYIVDDERRLSEICVPIKLGDQILGVIDSEHPEKDYFTRQHLRLLTAIASICANKIQRVRLEKEKEEALALMNELKSRVMRAQLSPHFVFNALNAIQHFIAVDDKMAANRFLSLFSKLIRYHLNHYERDIVLLSGEMEMLDWYLHLQHLRYEENFMYTIERTGISDLSALYIPSLILSSLFEFAVEQSMFLQQGQSVMKLHFHIANDQVELNVYFGPVVIPASSDKMVDYRSEIIPWDEQAKLLNRIKGYAIRTETELMHGKDGQGDQIHLQLILPLIPADGKLLQSHMQ
ncbi:MAG: histidine kinase [Saprospiraceae bacterium]|nr:histidine kinase [Saprospiraceae bacterium]